MRAFGLIALGLVAMSQVGCSSEFWKGGTAGAAAGAVGAGAGYEIAAKRQMDSLEAEYKDGKIDEREFELRKKQIQKGSLLY